MGTIAMTCACLAASLLLLTPGADAASLESEWASVAIPPKPKVNDAVVDPRTTALFMISMTQETCNPDTRPRCAATVPGISKLLSAARTQHVLVIHSLTRGASSRDRLVDALAPRDGEPILPAGPGPDKFIDSDLNSILQSKGIKSVIVVGTQAQTAVLHTAAGSAFRGYRAIVPIDGMSSDTAFPELYTTWHLATTSRIADFVTITATDRISFKSDPH
jgi:nicotinamidase-related amidase